MILGALLALLGVLLLFGASVIGAGFGAEVQRDKIARHLRKLQAEEATAERPATARALGYAAEDVERDRPR